MNISERKKEGWIKFLNILALSKWKTYTNAKARLTVHEKG